MVFKSESELKSFLLMKCQNAIVQAEEKIHTVIDNCLKQFYSEFSPEEYIRTEQLLHSLVRSGVESTNSGFKAKVYFDADALNYQTGVVQTQHGTGYATWSSEKVLDVAMTDSLPHGRYADGTAIWTESMNNLGNIWNLLEQELIAQGIPIKKK